MESLLVRTLESEKRLRSEGGEKKRVKEAQRSFRRAITRDQTGEVFHVSGEHTQHEDLGEPLDAEAFGAFPSAFTSAAHLNKSSNQ